LRLIVTHQARRDLNLISRYTLDNWGRTQLTSYMGGLLDCLDDVADNPMQGRNVPKIPTHYFRAKYQSHFIFYRCVGQEVRIIRILHQSMDPARHLS
jgi:toxin ParE1/3/4